MKSSKTYIQTLALAVALGASAQIAGCSVEQEGSLQFSVWGEEFIEEGIGADELEDGWAIRFEKFLIHVAEINVSDGTQQGGALAGSLVDLAKPGEKALGSLTLSAKAWPKVGYSLAKVAADTQRHASVSEADAAQMQQQGWSLRVVGSAEKDGVRKRFDWGFATEVKYTDCRSEVDGKEQFGAVAIAAQSENVQLTIHGDHLFYDDLGSSEAKLRFSAMAAADANDDGEITMAELEAVQLADLAGKGEGSYSVGGKANVINYGEFVRALTQSLGHYRGEGHCAQSAK